MNIIHCGDLHLGSPFLSGSRKASETRRRELWGEFENLMIFIKQKDAKIVLFSGDVFDGSYADPETVHEFFSKLSKLPETSFLITPGNHDYFTADSSDPIWSKAKIPDNVFVFTSENVVKKEFPLYGVDIYGYGFTSPSMPIPPSLSDLVLNRSRINILVGHASLDMPSSPHCPITSKAIADAGFDYAALGHIHAGNVISVGDRTKIAYSGCLMGRDFGETGPKGVHLIECSGGKIVTTRFHRVAKRSYETVSCDLTGASGTDAVCDLVTEALAKNISSQPSDVFLRLELKGDLDPSVIPDTEEIVGRCLRGFFYSEIKDETSPLLSSDELEKDLTIRGAFYRMLKDGLESADPSVRATSNEALRLGLRALSGKEVF
ncbi:MAG: metallophosphoesterase [Firmicutes bacterium]|nr:metallophosphoesterase [Candidatus Colimorpha enterica]